MKNEDPPHLNSKPASPEDDLARLVADIERALEQRHYARAAQLVHTNIAASFFGFPTAQFTEILGRLVRNLQEPPTFVSAAYRILTASSADLAHTNGLMESLDSDDPAQMFVLAMFRMSDFRIHGHITEALEQVDTAEHYLSQLRAGLDSRGGWLLHSAVQMGTTAMLAGDFTRALSSLRRAQMLPAIPMFTFLQREAIVKSALIHACFGNAATADGLLKRTKNIPRTSSWLETHIDTQEEFVWILTYSGNLEEALDRLEAISLQEIGEMWPFYIVAFHRVLEASGHHDELEHRLEMYDSLPLPRIDGEGFTGSIIPLKRAMVALSVGRGSEALKFLERTDQSITYTKLVKIAADLYVGRIRQAMDQAYGLRKETRGFRLMEIRRLSLLSASQYMDGDLGGCIQTLAGTASLPRGLSPTETLLFPHEMIQLAQEHVENWPKQSAGHSIFLRELPKPGRALTGREIDILELLAQGYSRAEIADRLFISVSTVKSQLQSLYRKLEVSSAADAIFEGERRGVL